MQLKIVIAGEDCRTIRDRLIRVKFHVELLAIEEVGQKGLYFRYMCTSSDQNDLMNLSFHQITFELPLNWFLLGFSSL